MAKMVPCKYKGDYRVNLHQYGGPYFDADGNQILDLTLSPGDTLMMPEDEVNGYTLLLDLIKHENHKYLGSGKVVLPQHRDKSPDELSAMGYQFHQGRTDFEAITTTTSSLKKKKESGE